MTSNWEGLLKDRLQLYGHRNWLVIADSAYPAQSSPGVETVVADEDQTIVLARTFAALSECRHIKPTVYIDKELRSVPEADAPGITSYRKELADLLKGQEAHELPHDEIIAKLDRVGGTFRVLLLKTNMTIPYTSVFLELQCGYWNAEAESRLRAVMRSKNKRLKAAQRKR